MTWADFLGPNIYLQAVGIAAIFIIAGKLAEMVLSRLILKLVSRSKTPFDDDVVSLLHRPIFISFVVIGLAMGTRRLGMAATPEFITLAILRTIAIVVAFES